MRILFVSLAVLVVVAVVTWLVAGCNRQHPKTAVGPAWSNDKIKLGQNMPLFTGIDIATWTVMKETDRSGGLVPGPSSYSTIGFAKVDQKTTDSLTALGTTADDGSALKTVESHLSDVGISPQQCKWKRVTGAERAIIGATKYRKAEMLIDPDTRVVFFRLLTD